MKRNLKLHLHAPSSLSRCLAPEHEYRMGVARPPRLAHVPTLPLLAVLRQRQLFVHIRLKAQRRHEGEWRKKQCQATVAVHAALIPDAMVVHRGHSEEEKATGLQQAGCLRDGL